MLEPLNYGSNHDEESRIKSPGFGYGLFLVTYTFIPLLVLLSILLSMP